MNVLADSNLEIFAFKYLNFGFLSTVNNLWPWVAVVTAAVSFWRMKASATVFITSSSSSINAVSGSSPSKSDQSLNDSVRFSEISQTSSTSPASTLHSASAVGFISQVENDVVVTKGVKFLKAYYVNEQEIDDELTLEEEINGEVVEGFGEWWESWDKGLRMRMGDMSWYRCQDLTEFNGNVVRLWDDRRAYKTYGIETSVVW